MTDHCSDDATMGQVMGKLAKGFSDWEVAVDLGPDYDMMEENSLEASVMLKINEEKRNHKLHALRSYSSSKRLPTAAEIAETEAQQVKRRRLARLVAAKTVTKAVTNHGPQN
ncbi:hypothetical protein FPQ18DRAFT_302655 [Pyronema domesticum]|nr:hypothetical protein FPQ18DRAFT_302655 [Pyronema domesticum]